jgi:ABC-type uncharacterized transport system substrate-binding protein
MNRNIFCVAVCALLYAFGFTAEAQQPKKVPRVGILFAATPSANSERMEAFRQGLRERGYVEGKDVLIEQRYAEGNFDRLPSLVTELVQLKVDVFIMGTLVAIRAAKQANTTIPIVMALSVDPVATGLVDSLAHPGGNVTGLTNLARDLSGKRLELFKEVVPGILRVAVLRDAGDPSAALGFKEYEAVGSALKVQLQSLEVRGPNPDFENAFQAAINGRASGLITIRGALFNRYPKQIAELAIKHRLPSMHEGIQYVEPGGLMSYATNDLNQWHRAATYVDKILKGAKPADLPVEQPTKFELVINLKTARQIGLTIPPTVLARADKVIK